MITIEEDNVKYHIGRNAKDNHDLFDKMNDNALWFHLNDDTGAHLYIVTDDEITNSHITRAGQLVKQYSKIYNKCNICYLEKKYLKKGKTPGLVIMKKDPIVFKI